MNHNNPTKGLLMYAFYSVRRNISIALLLVLTLGAALLITGNVTVYTFFVFVAILAFPYLIIVSMGAKNALKWEKYRISMPIKRGNLVASFYLSVLIATIVGLLVCGVILGISMLLHDDLLHHVIKTAFVQLSYSFGVVFLMTGLLLPIASTKFGEGRGEAFFTVCFFIAVAVMLLISWAGGRAELSPLAISLAQAVTAVVAFVVSYPITNRIYEKMDF